MSDPVGSATIAWRRIDTLFLDVGNTLTSIDFHWVAEELGRRGVPIDPQALRRAEARARPAISRRFGAGPTVVDRIFRNYLGSVLDHLPESHAVEAARRDELLRALEPVLWQPGKAHRLWRLAMPGARSALERATALGLRCVAVSNSDGTAHLSLQASGLADLVPLVIDSHLVGVEKPDPRIFEIALDRSGADPQRVLHVGDMPFADVEGARRAGLAVVLLDPYGDWEETECTRSADLESVVARIEQARGDA